ncbi:MAG TPA: acylglycerol kinase family protein, partial [Pyrinomonadaceae bacterium]|nr:acylglycerol kinase family protein [Pyrinomonadaceae bacterium]
MTSETRPLIIINNAAAKARRAWPIVLQHLEAAGVHFDFYETARPGDATIRTRKALRDGVNTVAVVGGDGTLSEAAEGFFEFNERLEEVPRQIKSDARLAILPAGTGDDFARSQMGRREPLRKWIDI